MTTELQPTYQHESDEIDLAKLAGKLMNNYKQVLIIATTVLALAIFYILITKPVYQADALIRVETNPNPAANLIGDMGGMLGGSDDSITKEIEIFRSRSILGQTVERFSLDISVSPDYIPIIGKLWALISFAEKPKVIVNQFKVPDELINEKFNLKLISKDKYKLFLPDGDLLFEGVIGKRYTKRGIIISVKAIQAEHGQKFKLVKQPFLESIEKLRNVIDITEKGKKSGMLNIALKSTDKKQAKAILNYLTEVFLLNNVEKNTREINSSLKFVQQYLPVVKGQLNVAEGALNEFRKLNETIDLSLEAKSTLEHSVAIDTKLNDLIIQEGQVSKRYTRSHPAYQSVLENRKFLNQERVKLHRFIKTMPDTQRSYVEMQRDLQVTQALYVTLLNKMQEFKITKASSVGSLHIVDRAMVSLEPVAPKKILILILAVFLGLIMGALYVVIREALVHCVVDSEQLEQMGLSTFASIPLSKNQKKGSDSILVLDNPTELAIESLKSLRTQLHFSAMQTGNNVLTLSGVSPSTGKSFVACNLAAVIAQGDKKVLLIDADLRRGYLHKYFNQQSRSQGLSNLLVGEGEFANLVNHTSVNNLDFIPRGKTPPNPSELLMLPKLKEFLDWAKSNYDWVIIDTPPILAVTDAAITATYSGTTLLIVRQDVTKVKELEYAVSQFEKYKVKISGVVLNGVVKKAGNFQSSYQYAYESAKD